MAWNLMKEGTAKMKKILALALAVLMVLSLSAAAFAEETKDTCEEVGITLTYPEEFDNMKGIVLPMGMGSMRTSDGIYRIVFTYCAFSQDFVDELNAKTADGSMTKEDLEKAQNGMGVLLLAFGIDGGRGLKELGELVGEDAGGSDEFETAFTEVGRHDDITYYAITAPEMYSEFADKLSPEYAEEYQSLQAALVEALKNAEYFTPVVNAGKDLLGKTLQFETTALDGSTVKSEDLFSAHEYTMLNIWATWCEPCKAELEELGNLHRRYSEQDGAIVGICIDANEEPELCKEILTERNVDYLNLLPYDGMDEELTITSIPVSIFVNRDGVIVLPPIVGADLASYEKMFDALLSPAASAVQTAAKGAPKAAASANGEQQYRVIVTDSDGAPVKGAVVQFCDETSCMMGKTDDQGIAVFPDAAEGYAYTVHILKVPEGYEKTEEEFTALETFCDISVVLQKS